MTFFRYPLKHPKIQGVFSDLTSPDETRHFCYCLDTRKRPFFDPFFRPKITYLENRDFSTIFPCGVARQKPSQNLCTFRRFSSSLTQRPRVMLKNLAKHNFSEVKFFITINQILARVYPRQTFFAKEWKVCGVSHRSPLSKLSYPTHSKESNRGLLNPFCDLCSQRRLLSYKIFFTRKICFDFSSP